MFISVFPGGDVLPRRRSHEAQVSEEEDESIVRFRALTAMAGSVDEAMRRADAMTRLELSLRVVPVRSAVPAVSLPHWGAQS
jgi:hypothetical protein